MYAQAMLATKANPNRMVALCEDDGYWAEQKVDGDRGLIHVIDNRVRAMTRNGQDVAGVPKSVLDDFELMRTSGKDWIIDGEYLLEDRTYYAFDILKAADESFMDLPYTQRRQKLEDLFAVWQPAHVVLLPVARTHEAKVELAKRVIVGQCEGLVFKRTTSTYQQARSESWWKVKLRYDLDCFVTELCRGGKDNIVVAVYRDGEVFELGECGAQTGDGKRMKFQVGDVVTIIYQYITKDDRVYGPTKPRYRKDKTREECTWEDQGLVHENKEILSADA